MENNWIRVEDKLPDDEGKKYGLPVLGFLQMKYDENSRRSFSVGIIIFKNDTFYVSYVSENNVCNNKFRKVTHWQYLPKHPKIK